VRYLPDKKKTNIRLFLKLLLLRGSRPQSARASPQHFAQNTPTFIQIGQGRIKASAGPGAVRNAGPLQTYSQVTTPTNCGPPELRARVLQHP